MQLLVAMSTDAKQPVPTALLAGEIVREEIARVPGPQKSKRVMEIAGISQSTLTKVHSGKPVSADTYWKLAGALGLPTLFFDWIISHDVERIKRTPGVREDLRAQVIERLQDLELPRNRRATDRTRKRGA